MSLSGSLQIGRSGLLASQAAIDVTGNNLANVATPGYHRQNIVLAPTGDEQIRTGLFKGRGVEIQQITRQVNEALESRMRSAVSDRAASGVRTDLLQQIQSLQNEFTDSDLSTQLDSFFNAWSELANDPTDNSVRTVVIQHGQSLAGYVKTMRSGAAELRFNADKQLDQAVTAANDLLSRIEQINQQIAATDSGSRGAHSLRDQRDELLKSLSEFIDISTVEQSTGVVDVYVGSLPIMLDGRSRGLEVRRTGVDGDVKLEVLLKADGSPLDARSGKIGALIEARKGEVSAALDGLDTFTGNLIYQINRVHSQGRGLTGYTTLSGSNRVNDAGAALNSAAAGLDFPIGHGSFEIKVTQKSTGETASSTIHIDLDNVDTANNTSLNSLIAELGGVENITASVTSDGRLKLDTINSDYEITLGTDTSGALAALGVNTFFIGTDAANIGVSATLLANPGKLAAAQGNQPGDNRNALAIAALSDQPIEALGGLSIVETWNRNIEEFAVRAAQAQQKLESDTVVAENLQAQIQSVSGVNSDEEAINLLAYQRAYQGSARFLSVVNQLYDTLLNLV